MRPPRRSIALLCLVAAGAISAFAGAQTNATSIGTAGGDPLAGAISPAQGSPQQQAATSGLSMLIDRLTSSSHVPEVKRIFGVDDRGLREATIGDGFETFMVDPQALLSGKAVDQSLYASGEWRFVVMARGKGIALITVARMNGHWTMVAAGANALAREIMSVTTRYARQSPDARLRFVRSPQAVADFIEISVPSDTASPNIRPTFVALASARSLLARHAPGAIMPEAALSNTELTDMLRPSVQRGMGDPRFGH